MEHYINFETAKLLKERGYTEPCRRCYDKNGDVAIEYLRPALPFRYADKDVYLCPTQAEVTDWLRREHKKFVEVNVCIDLNGNYHYSYAVLDKECKYLIKYVDDFPSHEDATEDAIISVLKQLDLWKGK